MKRLVCLVFLCASASVLMAQSEVDSVSVQIPPSQNVWRSELNDSLDRKSVV